MATAAGISSDIFSKCLPSFTADVKACGGLTLCDVQPATAASLESYFYDSGSAKFKVFGALIMAEFEMGACDVEQNGLYDLLMTTRRDWSKRLSITDMDGGLYEIKPFIMGRQRSVLNNEYWNVQSGVANGGNWQVDVLSQTGMPADVRWFLPSEHVFIFGRTANGTQTETAWKIITSTALAGGVRLVLESQNANSSMPSSRLGNPVTGYLIRGVGNINDYESWCYEGPGLNLEKRVPFWIGTARQVMCEDELWDKYRKALMADNDYWKTFVNVDTVEKNRQLSNDFKKKQVNSFFYEKRLANQDLTNYGSLETISAATTGSLVLPGEGRCIGKRANPVGIIEQLWECGQASDAQGFQFNLIEFFNGVLYQLSRVRSPSKDGRTVIESFTDSYFSAQIQTAMINYFSAVSAQQLRFVMQVNATAQSAALGFWYREYQLIYPNVLWRVVSHRFFDDKVEAAKRAGIESTGRVLWTIDWSDVYQGVIESNRRINRIGDIEKLSAIDSTLACVMKFPAQTYNLMSVTYANVVECPKKHYIINNLGGDVPEHRGPSTGNPSNYYGAYQQGGLY